MLLGVVPTGSEAIKLGRLPSIAIDSRRAMVSINIVASNNPPPNVGSGRNWTFDQSELAPDRLIARILMETP
jgi:hypothetical protein